MEETLEIRYVRPEDKAFWYSLDRHLPEEDFDKKLPAREAMSYWLKDSGPGSSDTIFSGTIRRSAP